MSCWEQRGLQTRPLKGSPLPLPAENFNLAHESQVAQQVRVLHPARWAEATGELARKCSGFRGGWAAARGRLSITVSEQDTQLQRSLGTAVVIKASHPGSGNTEGNTGYRR